MICTVFLKRILLNLATYIIIQHIKTLHDNLLGKERCFSEKKIISCYNAKIEIILKIGSRVGKRSIKKDDKQILRSLSKL